MSTAPRFPPALGLYYSPKACSLASHIALEEAGLEYAAVPTDIRAGAHRDPAYRALNPLGTVPALAIGPSILTESQAILTHVADLVPERGLLPRPGTLARARAHEWMNFISSTVHAAYRSVFKPEVYAGQSEAACDAVRSQGHDRLRDAMQTIETRLAAGPWAVGGEFTVVDAYLFVFYLWRFDERLAAPLPATERYRALAHAVWARPAVRRVVERERAVRRYALPPGFDDVAVSP